MVSQTYASTKVCRKFRVMVVRNSCLPGVSQKNFKLSMELEREFKMLFIHISLLRELHLDPSKVLIFKNVFNVIWLFHYIQ